MKEILLLVKFGWLLSPKKQCNMWYLEFLELLTPIYFKSRWQRQAIFSFYCLEENKGEILEKLQHECSFNPEFVTAEIDLWLVSSAKELIFINELLKGWFRDTRDAIIGIPTALEHL